ncbi:MAG TPA: 6-phosphogluconolactonase [Gemmatimonadales bacterium]|nr:6-phosphogluconolactonase [Gemmatimonadales bacterium]
MPSSHVVVEEADSFPRRVAEWLAETIARMVAASGQCTIALSGGGTPRPVYAALAGPELASGIDWRNIDVYFGDERAVPPDDRESNYRMAKDALLSHVPIPDSRVHRIEAERRDLDAAADAYARALPAALDVLVLGMGADGHTASLFPGSPALAERQRRVVVVASPKPPRRRVTITPPVIAAARQVVMLVTGREKATAVARALDADAPPPSQVPAVLARPPRGVGFLDPAAAARLAKPVR